MKTGPVKFACLDPETDQVYPCTADISWHRGRIVIEPWTDDETNAAVERFGFDTVHDAAIDAHDREGQP